MLFKMGQRYRIRLARLKTRVIGFAGCSSATRHQAPILLDLINGIPDFNFYQNGAQIACGDSISLIGGSGRSGAVCAFLQNSGSLGAVDIKPLAADLVNHGCTTCGSYPFPTGVNGVEGLLTFNDVGNANCFNTAY
ncbi:hypothetical protein B0H17DRAFT_1204392 [Mycena rosella]|uniref:Killer toxin Kp4 domain-containing protein n=1 Tax=Mycena rosella TaxID=1033263 RepID=A0AAD7D9T6_MYCRO|nr:hypothetical protein B0H17DRAFT_1204392 [Mycena rosella]